jgi:hypothetical protein
MAAEALPEGPEALGGEDVAEGWVLGSSIRA